MDRNVAKMAQRPEHRRAGLARSALPPRAAVELDARSRPTPGRDNAQPDDFAEYQPDLVRPLGADSPAMAKPPCGVGDRRKLAVDPERGFRSRMHGRPEVKTPTSFARRMPRALLAMNLRRVGGA